MNDSIPGPLIIAALITIGIICMSVVALLPPELTAESVMHKLMYGGLAVTSLLAAGADIHLYHSQEVEA